MPFAEACSPRSASTTESTCSAKAIDALHLRCICAALPNSAVLDQGGACGAAGPASAPPLSLGRPARRTPGHTYATRRPSKDHLAREGNVLAALLADAFRRRPAGSAAMMPSAAAKGAG